jgi:hypothetical protein
LYSERQAIPQHVTYKLDKAGALGERLEVIGRDAVVRELEAVVTLDRETAEELEHFLSSLLKGADGDEDQASEEEKGNE